MTNRKIDGKRIALKQDHEVAYVRKLARELILEADSSSEYVSVAKVKRVAKAFLKISKK